MIPRRPSDPRPNGKPFYIKDSCTDCGGKLKLLNDFHHVCDESQNLQFIVNSSKDPTDFVKDDIWHDEWICPKCQNGIYLDLPKKKSYYPRDSHIQL